ncbi:CpaF family protein [archaeon]|jgi:archaeal flagellar protein FlaI|nr:CpaF family protein [archaeon]MBT4241617.1 CpaF family protein [archaeon]MBT4418012.1 CpaF family protein [archaeon]
MANKKKKRFFRFRNKKEDKNPKEDSKQNNEKNKQIQNKKNNHQKNNHINHKQKHNSNHKHHQKNNHINHKQKHNSNHKHPQKEKPIEKKGSTLESYDILLDNVKVVVRIQKSTSGPVYNLEVPQINIATASLLDEVRNELVTATTVGMNEITDPNAFLKIKKRFMIQAEKILKEKLPNIEKNMKEFLVGKLMQDMLGLGEIEFLVNDVNLEEVVITSAKESIRVYHKKYGWLKSNLKIDREDKIVNYSNIIARRVGRQINVLAPLLDAHLITGDRINSILYPISTKGNTITIRKFARDPYTIIDLINNKTLDIEVASLLWLAIEYEMNVLISGGTASGKTSLLNACMPFIPPNHRIISVEDTRELMLPDFLYWCPLVTRSPNPEGKGEVSMLDLLINSLRMRPDRIVLGEMRRKEEAMVLFEAMHTGHSVYATVHADSAAETVSRLTNPPLSVPPNLLNAVNLNLVVFRDRRRGIRRVLQVAEFEAGDEKAYANILYRWIPEEDRIIKHSENSRFFEDITRNTGMSQNEIAQNIEEKKRIMSYLIKNKIRSLKDFGKVMNLYYIDKEELLRHISTKSIRKILKE